jgi:hypothetical protein
MEMPERRVTVTLRDKALESFEELRWELHAESLADLGERLLLEALAAHGKVVTASAEEPKRNDNGASGPIQPHGRTSSRR